MHLRQLLLRSVLGLLLLSGAGRLASAQPADATAALLDSVRPRAEQAVVRGDWPALDAVIGRLRTAVAAAPDDAALRYDLGYVLHRRASALLVEDRPKAARPLLEESRRELDRAVALGGSGAALALRGAVTGQLAGVLGVLGAMRLGPRAFRQLDEAVRLAPDDPRVALLNGITRLHAPRAFGGGAARAEPEFRRAVRLFADDRAVSPDPTWGHADAHIWLGIALREIGREPEARAAFAQALMLAPDHAWVTRVLVPAGDAGPAPR
jgi:tetratricopeptide (TPR) repeat protein